MRYEADLGRRFLDVGLTSKADLGRNEYVSNVAFAIWAESGMPFLHEMWTNAMSF